MLVRAFTLIKIQRVSLPNLLCEEAVVPEFLQEQVVAENMGAAVLELLESAPARARQLVQFAKVRQLLRRDAAASAARAIGELIAA
jgi:lipid-A-disaccharide synthase